MDNYIKYQLCTKTVMDTSDPTIVFDSNGISNHYWDFQNIVKPHWHPDATGLKNLEKIATAIKLSGRGRDYDCIMGLSGGIDSSYMLHKMVTDFELRPLVFHVDGGWNSETAVSNINLLIDKLGLDLYTEVINWNEMRDFQLAMFKSGVPHLDIPQDMAFGGVLNKYAAKHNIKYILNGGNISTECVLAPLNFLYWGSDLRQVKDILRRFGNVDMHSYPFCGVFYKKLISQFINRVKIFKPLNHMKYIKSDAANELIRIYGWKPYPQKHFESRFTKFFESYWLPTRFGYDMRRNQLSSLILTGQMSRETALAELTKPSYDAESILHEFNYISTKLGISTDELYSYLNMPKKYYWDYRNHYKLLGFFSNIYSFFYGSRRGGAY